MTLETKFIFIITNVCSISRSGAIISGGKGGAQDKIDALEKAGVIVTRSPAQMGRELHKEMKRLELV